MMGPVFTVGFIGVGPGGGGASGPRGPRLFCVGHGRRREVVEGRVDAISHRRRLPRAVRVGRTVHFSRRRRRRRAHEPLLIRRSHRPVARRQLPRRPRRPGITRAWSPPLLLSLGLGLGLGLGVVRVADLARVQDVNDAQVVHGRGSRARFSPDDDDRLADRRHAVSPSGPRASAPCSGRCTTGVRISGRRPGRPGRLPPRCGHQRCT